MVLTEEAKSLLERVAVHVLEEPKRLNMAYWFLKKENYSSQTDSYSPSCPEYEFGACGTAACIAGWTVLLHDGNESDAIRGGAFRSVSERAREILGLEMFEGSDLFYPDRWDWDFYQEYQDAETAIKKAEVAAAYIRHYIKTRG